MAQAAFHGNVGKVHGVQFANDGQPRFKFSVGESHSKFDKQQNKWIDTGTTWWNVTVFGKRAEALAETIREGAKQQVVVIGRSETREYDHNGEKRTSLDCTADVVGVIPKAQHAAQQPQGGFGRTQGGFGGGFGGQPQPGAQNPNAGGWGNPGADAPPF